MQLFENWTTLSPEEKGLDGVRLNQMDREIAAKYPNILSALILRDGVIVHERYYHNNGSNDALPVMSINKSILSALIGMAIKKGVFHSLDQLVLDFFRDMDLSGIDPHVHRLTLRHLLTMTSGFYYTRLAGDAQPIWHRTTNSRNWVEFSLKLPVRDAMGQHFNYKNTDALLAAACLSRATDKPIGELLEAWLFQPLGIEVPRSESEDPQRLGIGPVYLPARDMAKFGHLYLQQGSLGGNQIIPAEWVKESTTSHVKNYGYFWWVDPDGYSASGAGGALIQVIPKQQTVVVFQSKHLRRFKDPRDLVRHYVI